MMAFEQVLAQRLGIKMKIRKSSDNQAVFQLAKKCIDQGHPVYIYVDMPFLPYLAQDLWETGDTHLLEPMHTQILSLLKSETELFKRLQEAMA